MNRLQHASSPYLLQHAQNPVDWYEWGEEALQLARNENRPIFLSIGYAACHWCHVMAHESFEDAETAALMNANFVNIKVDREQRPDLDSIYMAATVAMTGSGGWPMSVFLTPDLQPFYAGTYFPSQARFNLPSFRDLLSSIARAWSEEHEHVLDISSQVTAHLKQQSSALAGQAAWSENQLDAAARRLYDDYDWGFGGWGGAPKFPQPMTIEFLLRRALTRPGSSSMTASDKAEGSQPDFLKPVVHVLRAMARGGMYDVVGGGFSRYSTDIEWRVPHFEKMLYDNAQLALVYLHAWQVTGEPFFRRVVEQTLNFVLRELQDPQGGFYSSLDADSEGEEGKFYLWSYAELKDALAEELDFFRSAYFVSPQGNWEGRIILQRALDDASLASRFGITHETVVTRLAACHSRLLAVRSLRPRPGTDDKILAAWNGLMLSALAQAARSLPANPARGSNSRGNSLFLDAATRNADFMLTALMPNGSLRRSWRAGVSSPEVFLDDFAALILGLLDLYETDFNNRWFIAALGLADEMMRRFDDPAGGFFDTPVDGESLLFRPKDLQDNAIPSGNALACEALLRLAAFSDRVDFRQKAEQMLGLMAEPALRFPTAFGRWLQAADFGLASVKQIAILGQDDDPVWQELLSEVRRTYRPRMVVSASTLPVSEDAPFVLQGRDLLGGQPTAYVCEGFFCKLPVVNPQSLRELLESDSH